MPLRDLIQHREDLDQLYSLMIEQFGKDTSKWTPIQLGYLGKLEGEFNQNNQDIKDYLDAL